MGVSDEKARENKGKHEKEVYIAWIKSTPTYGTKLTRGTYSPTPPQYIRIKCPVDVYVYDGNEELAGSVVGSTVELAEQSEIAVFVEGDVKNIFMPADENYTIKIIATDAGLMNIDISEPNLIDENEITKTIFQNVQLHTGKQMMIDTVGVASDSNMKLFLLDDSGLPTAEVMSDGFETPIENNYFSNQINVTVNGQKVDFPDVQPIILNHRTYVPVRFVAENMEADVEWFDEGQKAMLTLSGVLLELTIGSKQLMRYENENIVSSIQMDVEPLLIDGRTMLPIRFVAEDFGYSVEWIEDTQTVQITLK